MLRRVILILATGLPVVSALAVPAGAAAAHPAAIHARADGSGTGSYYHN